jgi:uncharacterized protein (DUF1330 family)
MRTRIVMAVAVISGFGLGAVTTEGLRAQAKPPIYVVAEVDVQNIEAYTKEYAPRAQALIKKHGGRFLAAGQKVTSLEGAPPQPRVAIQQWESMEKIKAWRDDPEYWELRKIGNQHATFRIITVEGLPQQ